jgi:exodeoxyribonuclease V alpha subunit
MSSLLPAAALAGLRTLDTGFARWVSDNFCPADSPQAGKVARLAAAVSYALHLKHSCLQLDRVAALQEPVLNALLHGISAADISRLVDHSAAISLEAGHAPLLCSADGNTPWLHKYFLFEQAVAARIRAMAASDLAPLSPGLGAALDRLYPPAADGNCDNGQRRACELALSRRLAVVTGGPGTGKTWTVARIIALLQLAQPGLQVELAAPTGKAAKRMMDSLQQAFGQDQRLAALAGDVQLPARASTLHSLLGIGRHSPKPRRNRHQPLALDVLIVDEASMVDLPMMARLLDALPPQARLVLLGDKDQLASVEAGGVLAELCYTGPGSLYQGMPAAVAMLEEYHRGDTVIKDFADQLNAGQAGDAIVLAAGTAAIRLSLAGPAAAAAPPAWLEQARQKLQALVAGMEDGQPVTELLALQPQFQLLCALREGPFGVNGINAQLERSFGQAWARHSGQSYLQGEQAWFAALPVMVLRNDHERRLYNGDAGLVLPVTERAGEWHIDLRHGQLMACFPADDGARAISFAQMPPFESCYALTVHKSQGSEYQQVMLVLPDDAEQVRNNPVITRELLYTAITRARERLEICCGEGVLETAASRQTVRMSGLRQMPWV